MRKNLTHFWMAFYAVCLSFLATNCATEELDQQNAPQSTTEVKIWFDSHKSDYSATILDYASTLDWDNAIISNGDLGQVIEVPFTLKGNLSVSDKDANLYNDHHRLMFLKGENKAFKLFYVQIFTTDKKANILDKHFNYYSIKDNFDGKVFVQELATNIVSKLEFENGNKIKPSLTSKLPEREVTCVYYGYWFEDGHFEPIKVVYCEGGGGSGEDSGGGYGGGGTTTPATPAKPTPDPCAKIKALIDNPNFIVKLTDLSTKTGLKLESGYSQSKNGPFTPLVIAASTAATDALTLNVTPDMKGYMHTHLNDYETGREDPDGAIETRHPIRMFSPADIDMFLKLVKNAQTNNIPIDEVYGTLVTSEGNYQLRFTGDVNQINTNFDWKSDSLTKDYRKTFLRGNNEVNFLTFLSESSYIQGIELYKLNKDNTSTKKTLDANKKIKNTDC